MWCVKSFSLPKQEGDCLGFRFIRDRDQPHHPRRRPRPLKSKTVTKTETQYLSCQIRFFSWKIIFSLGNIFFYTKKHHFFTGDIAWNLQPTRCFFHDSIFILFFLRSCGLDRESRARPRRDRETHKIRSRDLHHWVVVRITRLMLNKSKEKLPNTIFKFCYRYMLLSYPYTE